VLSPDELILYVADTTGNLAMAFDVASDGSLSLAGTFVDDLTGPDGMAIDAEGNLFVTDRTGVRRVAETKALSPRRSTRHKI
jgi:sugar lactone lactonase YvrE